MGLCVLYYVEYRLYNVKKAGFFYLGWNYTLSWNDVKKELAESFHTIGYPNLKHLQTTTKR